MILSGILPLDELITTEDQDTKEESKVGRLVSELPGGEWQVEE